MNKKTTIGIIGGAGYTAGELIRLVCKHPKLLLDFVYSTSNAGNLIANVHQDLIGELEQRFTDVINSSVDVVFLCLGHGNSSKFLNNHTFSNKTKIIDLSNDFRLQNDSVFQGKNFVYGLTEAFAEKIKNAQYLANPGCFATAIQLALLPLATVGLLDQTVHINATTGATGAGVSPSVTSHFPWRDNNFSVYKPFVHQHLGEIGETLTILKGSEKPELLFIPNRGNFSRGIFVSLYTKVTSGLEIIKKCYRDFYAEAPFTYVVEQPLHLKQVVNTNKCLVYLESKGDYLMVYSAIDNLLKGASGQAVQNLNLMMGWEESLGLQLKGSGF